MTTQTPDPGTASRQRDAARTLRRWLLALTLVGSAGLGAELVLLEHFENPWQWTPLLLLGATLVLGTLLAVRPSGRVVHLFRGVMALALVSAVLGVWFHYQENVAFERELDAAADVLVLVWRAIWGATPMLAPGAMAQLGVIGLLATYRHPVLATGPDPSDRGETA